MSDQKNPIKSLRKGVKRGLLKALEPYDIKYITPTDQKLLQKAKEDAAAEKKKKAEEAAATKRDKQLVKQAEENRNSEDEKELAELKEWLGDTDREHIWSFNAGNSGQDFRGNPKFLFAYINNYRADIKALWICSTPETIELIRSLGFHGYLMGTPAAEYAISRVGVAVCEQVRGLMPFDDTVKYLNLWHGWGYKPVERARVEDGDDLKFDLCPKYIKHNSFYQNNQILCVVNSIQENYFYDQMGVTKENMLRCGYPRCIYQKSCKPIVTFDHDILAAKGLPEGTKIAVYAPTFRNNRGNTFADALPDLDALYKHCEEKGVLLIFKMHPLMETETAFLTAKEKLGDKPYFMFWDNHNDIYEVMHKIDLLIYDYSSIFSDFLLAGVKSFIRYIFDGDDMAAAVGMNDDKEYYDNSRGRICRTFEEMLDGIDRFEEDDEEEPLDKFLARQWEYAQEDDLERMIEFTLGFKIKDKTYPKLYSFDIFDTLISRKGLDPDSIFYAMREKMRADRDMCFDSTFIEQFPQKRHHTEFGLREYMNKSMEQRYTIKREITLEQIYREIQVIEDLTEEQTRYLIKLECDTELDAVVPLQEQIDRVKELLAADEKVVLISDMYLPKDLILKMLEKADPALTEPELFLSNEYGVLKTDRLLFFEVYRSVKPFYYYSKWIHTGDNINADRTQPRRMNIETRTVARPVYNSIEIDLTSQIGSYDSFKIAAMQARMRSKYDFPRSEFVIDFVAPLMVSYIDWALRDALKNGFETLYFVSRDGHPLKRIADALISANGWKLKTKYIYASRRVWRVPSYIDKVDDEFFADYGGNFNEIHTKDKFIAAACFESEEEFKRVIPHIDLDSIDFNDWSDGQPARSLAKVLKASEPYHKYLLEYAEKHRPIVEEYLLQEVDKTEKHAFVEFFGRGYNQTCHSRIWNHAIGKEVPMHYYYAHVMFPDEGCCVRHRLTATGIQMFFIESIFANMPYKSIEEYERLPDGRIVPVKHPISCDMELFNAMEQLLPEYAKGYAALDLDSPVGTDRNIFDFLISYYENNKSEPFIYQNFGSLVDAVSIYGDKKEFARPYTEEDLDRFMNGEPRRRGTMSITISYQRSSPEVKLRYDEMYQIEPGDNVAGGTVLKEPQLLESRGYLRKLSDEKAAAKEFMKLYKTCCQSSNIEDKIVIISETKTYSDSLYSITAALEAQDTLKTEFFTAFKITASEKKHLARAMSEARYVLLNGNVSLISGLELREGSKLMIIGKSAFELFRKGHSARINLKNKKRYQDFVFNIKADAYDSASDLMAPEIRQKYSLSEYNTVMLKGSPITDVYSSESYRQQAKEKLWEMFPEAREKKVIFYALELRRKENSQRYFEMLDIEAMQRLLGDEYVLVIDTRNHKELIKICTNTIEIEGFSKLINSNLRIRELMMAADVIIGDYRDSVFEAVMLNKPVFFTGCDYEKKQRDENFMRDISRILPYPIVRNAEQLAEKLKELDDYDFKPLEEFRKKYFTYCDGHVSERIVRYMLDGK